MRGKTTRAVAAFLATFTLVTSGNISSIYAEEITTQVSTQTATQAVTESSTASTQETYTDDELRQIVEAKGYLYFSSYQEAYDYVANLYSQLPLHTPVLQDNMTFIAYRGEANDDIINDFVFSQKDLQNYAGNRVYSSVLEAATERTGNRTSNSFDSYGISSYILLHSWRTYWVKRDYISDDQFYEAYNLAQDIANQLNYGTDYEKAKRAYEWVCTHISYDYDNHKASMYSGLQYRNTICTGYAQTFFQICEDMGLHCKIVYSKTHAYNLIQLDGVWYIADTTQDAEYNIWDYNCMFVGTNNAFLNSINDGSRYGDNIYEDIPVSWDDYVPNTYTYQEDTPDTSDYSYEEPTYEAYEEEYTEEYSEDDTEEDTDIEETDTDDEEVYVHTVTFIDTSSINTNSTSNENANTTIEETEEAKGDSVAPIALTSDSESKDIKREIIVNILEVMAALGILGGVIGFKMKKGKK